VKVAARAISPQALVAAAFRLREIGIFIALVIVVLLFSIRATNFATVANWRDIATDVAMVIVVAVGETRRTSRRTRWPTTTACRSW
jgi:predicted ABC-type sugar transport system permease subunit